MIRRPPRSTHCISSAASDVYKRQMLCQVHIQGQCCSIFSMHLLHTLQWCVLGGYSLIFNITLAYMQVEHILGFLSSIGSLGSSACSVLARFPSSSDIMAVSFLSTKSLFIFSISFDSSLHSSTSFLAFSIRPLGISQSYNTTPLLTFGTPPGSVKEALMVDTICRTPISEIAQP
eukprot:TRINITY_DN8769_c0_g1_i5.p1 TRINITY_DN8769_c0_g1~~TRINITY_DN8769_c0_g1_i5.p1  ORF type:complete len:182 (-),score=9.52 TRINITY_DN8769_c0_g1_i5:444-968(-)